MGGNCGIAGSRGRMTRISSAMVAAEQEGDRRVKALAPFVTSTDKWLSLALKRIITMAAQEGYDKVAFVNGEQSAERYLSKQVSMDINATQERVTSTTTATHLRFA